MDNKMKRYFYFWYVSLRILTLIFCILYGLGVTSIDIVVVLIANMLVLGEKEWYV